MSHLTGPWDIVSIEQQRKMEEREENVKHGGELNRHVVCLLAGRHGKTKIQK